MNIGALRHAVTVEHPLPVTPDGDGAYVQNYTPGTPPIWPCRITTATAQELERLGAGTAVGMATHILRGRYRVDLTIQSRITYRARVFTVTSLIDTDERQVELTALCQELTT